jgi:hypothetical protein
MSIKSMPSTLSNVCALAPWREKFPTKIKNPNSASFFPFKAIQGYSKLFKPIQSIFEKKKDSFLSVSTQFNPNQPVSPRACVLDCGGTRSTTPLFRFNPQRSNTSTL